MSKIPPGEWSAIAARHAKGESLSAIARSYGCTPPAIHYVLKRNERQAVEDGEQPVEAPPAPAPPSEPASQAPPAQRLNGEIRLVTKRETETADGADPDPTPPAMGLASRQPQPAAEPQPHPDYTRPPGRPLASNEGLDRELYGRAEAAIQTFRSCFDAALAEGSPHERARLRQAASDLMRVAARTTIVLDRLNALSERAAPRFDPRSNRTWPI
jgi:transposase-like protein